MNKPRHNAVGWLLFYLTVLITLTWLVWRARQQAIASLATPEAQSNWSQWRGEALRQAEGDGPVARRVPKSAEPPELVLLRDHFTISLVGLYLLTTALFITLMAMFRGVAGGRRFEMVKDADTRGPPIGDDENRTS